MLQVQDPNARLPAIVALDIYTEYKPQKDGSLVEEDRIKWCRRGAMGSETSEAVKRLQRDDGPIWQALKPSYDAWKQGKTAPLNGVPLSAWPGATPQLVKALDPYHIRTVEDLAEIEEGVMTRINLPGIRSMKANARAFLDAQKTTSAVAGEIATLRELATSQANEIEELKSLVQQLTPKEKRGPGRPPKTEGNE